MGMAAVVGGPLLGQALLYRRHDAAGARGGSNALMILRFVRDDPMTRRASFARICLLHVVISLTPNHG
jgi:hypothetical protein